ncbi:MAG TPA: amidase family protein [Pseudomonadales bacterium]|nr:amidase family protein [Pseudomonadales bacterium]
MSMPTVVDAARAIRSGATTSEALTLECLAAIERRNPTLNAFVHLDADGALAAARAVDRAVRAGDTTLGPLAGVPFGVKDLENCAGMPTTRGSRWFANGPPATIDDMHVARLRKAGAIPLGKTAAPEFGAWAYTASPALGVTRNPWNTRRTPGGSSGGSSAAVSAGLVPFCTASDGGGSIRTPAAFTGLVGLKPTYGRIPTFGVTHIAQNAVVGSLATTVTDTALLLDVMAGPDARDRTCLPPPGVNYVAALDALDVRGLDLAWSLDLGFAVVDPEVAAICKDAVASLVAAIEARRVDDAIELDDYIRIYGKIEGVDKFVNIDPDLWQNHLDELDPLNAPGWEKAATVTLPKSARIEAERRAFVLRVAEYFERFDVIVTPMVARPAFAAEGPMPTEVAGVPGHGGVAVIHGMLANLANLPAISLPAGLTQDGLPVALQIIGPRYREDLLLAIARRYERARPWPRFAPMGRD